MISRESTQTNDNENYRALSFYIVYCVRWSASVPPSTGVHRRPPILFNQWPIQILLELYHKKIPVDTPNPYCVDTLTFTASQINNKVWLAGCLFHYNRFNWIKSFTCNTYNISSISFPNGYNIHFRSIRNHHRSTSCANNGFYVQVMRIVTQCGREQNVSVLSFYSETITFFYFRTEDAMLFYTLYV